MKMKYYLAYGSNLSLEQMAVRCPDAFPVATAVLPGYLPCFRTSGSGAYLTVEEGLDYTVSGTPVLVWAISDEDEKRLDRYEGYPTFYYKKRMSVSAQPLYTRAGQIGRPILCEDALIYIMHEDRKLGSPSNYYLDVCMDGYRRFGFDTDLLLRAVMYSEGDDFYDGCECDLPFDEVPPCVTSRKKKRINWEELESEGDVKYGC